jgi:hypothetical protein
MYPLPPNYHTTTCALLQANEEVFIQPNLSLPRARVYLVGALAGERCERFQ